MRARYGYSDGSGDYFITIDTDKCDGCALCVTACPSDVFRVVDGDPNDPMNEQPVAIVREDKKKKLNYECAPCKPTSQGPAFPCVKACKPGAIEHSW